MRFAHASRPHLESILTARPLGPEGRPETIAENSAGLGERSGLDAVIDTLVPLLPSVAREKNGNAPFTPPCAWCNVPGCLS